MFVIPVKIFKYRRHCFELFRDFLSYFKTVLLGDILGAITTAEQKRVNEGYYSTKIFLSSHFIKQPLHKSIQITNCDIKAYTDLVMKYCFVFRKINDLLQCRFLQKDNG